MAEDVDVQMVESIGGIDGTPLASNVQSVHTHGFVGASSTTTTSNPIVVVVASKKFTIASNSVKVQMQWLVVI
jgi:microcystin-dependent protein